MSKLKLTCPHCGYSKDVQRDMIPHDEVRLKCPKCAESFVFNVKEAEGAAEAPVLEEAVETAPQGPSAVEEPPAEEAPDLEEKIRAVCPACGFFRKISTNLIPPEGKRIKCPKCKEAFTVGGPQVESAEETPALEEGAAGPTVTTGPEHAGAETGELSELVAEPITGEPEEPLYAEPEYLFGEETEPPSSGEGLPLEPEYEPEHDETGVVDLSAHLDEPAIAEEQAPERYHPARNVPQAETAHKAGGYQTSLPEDLISAAEKAAEEEIEIVPQAAEEAPAAPVEKTEPAPGYAKAAPGRARAKDEHAYAVKTSLSSLIKDATTRKRRLKRTDLPEVEILGTGEERDYLVSVSDLFRETWVLLRSRTSTFIPLMLLCPALVLAAMSLSYGIGYLFGLLMPGRAFELQTVGAALGIFISVYLLSWWAAAFIKAISDETLRAGESLAVTKPLAGAYMWLVVVSALVVTGGYLLFVIPGVLMTVWFVFSYFILVDEGDRGLGAMIKSREYVRGFWEGVLWRLLIVWLVPTAILAAWSSIFIVYLFYLPFATTYTYMLYLDLREIKGAIRVHPRAVSVLRYTAVAVIGLITPFAVGAVMIYGGALETLNSAHGLDTRTLLAQLTGEDDEVRDSYLGYREALWGNDTPAVFGYLTDSHISRLRSSAGDVLKYKRSLSPDGSINITAVRFDNISARLSLESERDGGVMIGNAVLVKHLGSWYLEREDWNLNVRPRPVRLKDGEPAPSFTPVDVGFITPGLRYGGAGTSSFVDPINKIRLLNTLVGHEGNVTKVKFMPDGRRLVSAGGEDRTVRLWDVVEGKLLDSVTLTYPSVGMGVTPDGMLVVVSDSYGNLTFIQLENGSFSRPELTMAGLGSENRLAVSPNGLLLATASMDGFVTLWDLNRRRMLSSINTPEPMRALVFSPAGDLLAVSSSTNKFTLFSLENGSGKTYTIPRVSETSDVSDIDISIDGKYLITGHMDSSITVWEIPGQKELFNYSVRNAPTWDVEFCPDGKCYATSQQDSSIYVWDRITENKLETLEGHEGTALSLAFSPDGRLLASGGSDKKIMIWGASMPGEAVKGILSGLGRRPGEEREIVRPARSGMATGRASASLGLDKTEFDTGEEINITYMAGDDFEDDAWVGIVPSSVPHGSETENDRNDISGMILEGSEAGNLTLTAPELPGDYDIRMFTSDKGGVEAVSLSIAVK